MKHFLDIGQDFYKQEISGALIQPRAERYNMDKFYRSVRVNKRFFEKFQISNDSLVGNPQEPSEQKPADSDAVGAATAGRAGTAEAASEDKKKID
eukprot:8840952-Pyramimonas_sp.AAC.1